MACPAFPRHHRPMSTLTGKRTLVVATETEIAEIFAVFQEETAVSPVGLVAGQTVTVLDGRMDNRSLAGGLMTGGAELLSLRDQREPFFPRRRMLRRILLVTGEAVAILGRTVRSFR